MVKASGDKTLHFPDMTLVKDQNGIIAFYNLGKPFIELFNQNRLKIYENLNIQNIHLSISHDDDTSVAFVILE